YSNQHTVPGIMTACDLSADGKTVTYHLRQGVISAAGNEFTADDVIWRFDRERKRPIIYALISRLFNLDKATYEKVDKYTVKLTNPTAAPLACSGLTNFYYPWPDSKEIAKHATADDPYSDKWIATHAGGNGQMWLILNNKLKPFDDQRVREAINYLIPRNDIVKDVYHGMARPWHGVISSVTPGYEDQKPYDFDPEKAKKLLADAGYANGFEADLVFSAGVPEMENIAVILQ